MGRTAQSRLGKAMGCSLVQCKKLVRYIKHPVPWSAKALLKYDRSVLWSRLRRWAKSFTGLIKQFNARARPRNVFP
jgi:hypothetical protein